MLNVYCGWTLLASATFDSKIYSFIMHGAPQLS